MFHSGLRLKLLDTLSLLGLILSSNLICASDYDAEPPQMLPYERMRSVSQVPEILDPLHEINGVFTDKVEEQRQFVPAHLLERTKPLSKRKSGPRFLRVNYDVPPTPLELSNQDSPSETVSEPPFPYETTLPMTEEAIPVPAPMYDPVFSGVVNQSCCPDVENWSPFAQWLGFGRDPNPKYGNDIGIGHERVVFAPFEIDVTQPTNFTMVRWDSGFGLQTPDRAEYFMSAPPKGPAGNPNQINFQDLRFVNETGSDALSVQTEIPVRFLEADGSGSTSGLGDMKVATKARLINGKHWQITQIFRTYIPTGSASKGVGTGHVSLEPGLLTRYEINPGTFIHGEVKYMIPIAADPGLSSNVLTYGVGISHVFYETNTFAFIPDFEMVNYDFLNGQKTLNGISVPSGDETAINLIPGARFVIGPKGDLGLFEFGISNMIGVGVDRYVSDLVRLDFKFVY